MSDTDRASAEGQETDTRGTNQTGVKLYNERLVLSLVRAHGALSKGEIARLTGLSAQASSVIMNQLESDGLLVRGAPQRGKVGQPAVPMALNPDGAFSVGFKIGRRQAELALVDMVGTLRERTRVAYAYPTPRLLTRFFTDGLRTVAAGMTRAQRARICGVGIAAPSEMWSWEEEVGAPPEVIAAWRHFDLKAEVAALCTWPVHAYNDATAACAAELAFGEGRTYPDFLYVFFATLVGGGVVLDGALYPGRQGYAGAIGSAPVAASEPGGPPRRLIQCASIYLLERMIRDAGGDPAQIHHNTTDWSAFADVIDGWVEQATDGLALAIGGAIAVIDFHNVVIDGAFPPHVRAQLVRRTRDKLAALAVQGVAPVEIVEGKIGSDARVLGAATLPLLAGYARHRDLLFN